MNTKFFKNGAEIVGIKSDKYEYPGLDKFQEWIEQNVSEIAKVHRNMVNIDKQVLPFKNSSKRKDETRGTLIRHVWELGKKFIVNEQIGNCQYSFWELDTLHIQPDKIEIMAASGTTGLTLEIAPEVYESLPVLQSEFNTLLLNSGTKKVDPIQLVVQTGLTQGLEVTIYNKFNQVTAAVTLQNNDGVINVQVWDTQTATCEDEPSQIVTPEICFESLGGEVICDLSTNPEF